MSAELLKEIKNPAETTKKNSEGLASMQKSMDAVTDRLSKTPAANPNQALGPWFNIRQGENPLTSRGFSFMKMLGMMTGACTPEEAKVEMDVHHRLHKAFVKDLGAAGYSYKGIGADGRNRFMAPLAVNYMHDAIVDRGFRQEMKQLVWAGTEGADHDHMNWIQKKRLQQGGFGQKTLSWLNDLTGGALVAPPEQGELIELLRNKEALVDAGARTVPLPPQGRLQYPRQTAASSTYWVGENSPIPASDIGTGEVTLQGKKLAVLIKAPNELIRFASPAAEALMRDDMTKSLALGLDLAGLEGLGGDNRPLGIINQPNINTLVSSQPSANGSKVVGQDIYRMIAVVEENNAEFEGWIMRPKTLYKYYQLRADAVAQGDSSGPYLFNLIREAGDGCAAMLGGYPVTKSTQVSGVQVQGSNSNLTYIIGGMWSDLLIGMFGAIEFAATTMGDTSFVNDQTWVRGILTADIAPRHAIAFSYLPNLSTVL